MRHNPARLTELKRHLILNSPQEEAYDDITRLLASSLDVPITMVNLLDERRDWFKASVGFPATESPAETSFCEAFFSTTDDLIVVPDTSLDARFAAHPLVVRPPNIRFYAAARLTSGEHTLGTLCAYDVHPHTVSEAQMSQLQLLASQVLALLAKRLKSGHAQP